MKRVKLLFLCIAMIGFVACSNDDDSSSNQDCLSCSFSLEGELTSAEICDNGDGTITVSSGGQEETEDLEGITFDDFIAALETIGGGTCD